MKNLRYGKYQRVGRVKAKKLYKDGKEIKLFPCNINPTNMWVSGFDLSKDKADCDMEEYFDKKISEYERYNCNTVELGLYCAYYVEDEDEKLQGNY